MIDPDYTPRIKEDESIRVSRGLTKKDLDEDYFNARDIWNITDYPRPEEID